MSVRRYFSATIANLDSRKRQPWLGLSPVQTGPKVPMVVVGKVVWDK